MNYRILLEERNKLEKRIEDINKSLKEQKLYMVNIITTNEHDEIVINHFAFKTFEKAQSKFNFEMVRIATAKNILLHTNEKLFYTTDNDYLWKFNGGQIVIEEVYIEI